MKDELHLYGLSQDGGYSEVKVMTMELADEINNDMNTAYPWLPICSLSEALAARKNTELVEALTRRLEDLEAKWEMRYQDFKGGASHQAQIAHEDFAALLSLARGDK